LSLNTKDMGRSDGTVDVSLADAMLKLSDPRIGLPDQTFNKALMKASLTSGTLTSTRHPD